MPDVYAYIDQLLQHKLYKKNNRGQFSFIRFDNKNYFIKLLLEEEKIFSTIIKSE